MNVIFSLLLSTLFIPVNHVEAPPNETKYEYIHVSLDLAGLTSNGNRARVFSDEGNRLFNRNHLKDSNGNVIRFTSLARLIEYLERNDGYTYLNSFITGDTVAHLIMRRPYSGDKNEYDILLNDQF